jgi:hypothetical protein
VNPRKLCRRTLRFGTILTGAKLVDNLDFREQLRVCEQEAIGGEMEGAGLYVACHDQKIDWILVKAICDFADGRKAQDKDSRQALAAKNAADFMRHALQFAEIDWDKHRGAARSVHPDGHAGHIDAQASRHTAYRAIWKRLQEAEAKIRTMNLAPDESYALARDVNFLVMKNEVFIDAGDRSVIGQYLKATFGIARYIQAHGSHEERESFASTAAMPDDVADGATELQRWGAARDAILDKVRSVLDEGQ